MKFPTISPPQVRHAVKTALAAVAAYALTALFSLPQGYWAVISVIVVMQANLGGSLKAGINRVIGTAVGAALGSFCLLGLGSGSVALGVGVGLTILVCAYFIHLHESFRMAGLTAAIIILLGGQSGSYFHYALMRFLEISVGVSVALAVSALVWPSRAGRQLRSGVARVLIEEAFFYEILAACRAQADCREKDETGARGRLRATRSRNGALLEEAKREPSGFSRGEHITVSLYNFTERIAEHLLSMDYSLQGGGMESLHGLVSEEMDRLVGTTVAAMTRLAEAVGAGRAPGSMAELAGAVDGAEEALTRLRKKQVLPAFDLETIMRFYSFYYNMREVALEVAGMAERAMLLEGD